MSTPIIRKRRILAFAIETTAGTLATLSSANALFVFDPVIQPTIAMTERVATGTIGRLAGVPGSRAGKLTFNLELVGGGSGSAPEPTWAPALLGSCGMVGTSHVYTPSSVPANWKTLTVGIYETTATGALFKRLAGCMGSFVIEAETGKPAMVKFSYEGIWQPPIDTTQITLPAFATIPPRFAQAAFTLGGTYAPRISKLNLDYGGKIKMREDITTPSGFNSAILTDRDIKGTIDPEADSVVKWDPHGLWVTPTTQAMNLSIGSVAGNTITLAAPAFQFADVQEGNRDEIVTNDLKYGLTPNAGDDELSITFS